MTLNYVIFLEFIKIFEKITQFRLITCVRVSIIGVSRVQHVSVSDTDTNMCDEIELCHFLKIYQNI